MYLDHYPWTYRHTLVLSAVVSFIFWLTGAPVSYILYVLLVYPLMHFAMHLLRR